MKKEVYKQLTEPLYKLTKDDPIDVVIKELDCLCTQLRLDQRSIAILGIRKDIEQNEIDKILDTQNDRLKDDSDSLLINIKRVNIKDYDVLIIYREEIYLKLFDEICSKKKHFSPSLFHYVFTKLFGYSDRALKLFLKKWVDK